MFDDAAEESDDQERADNEQEGSEQRAEDRPASPAGSDVDSSDEEEGGNEYDMTDKFIAPEGEEEGGEESESDEEGGRRKKKKRRRREVEELDEEDYALLEEQGVRVDVSRCQLLFLAQHTRIVIIAHLTMLAAQQQSVIWTAKGLNIFATSCSAQCPAEHTPHTLLAAILVWGCASGDSLRDM